MTDEQDNTANPDEHFADGAAKPRKRGPAKTLEQRMGELRAVAQRKLDALTAKRVIKTNELDQLDAEIAAAARELNKLSAFSGQ